MKTTLTIGLLAGALLASAGINVRYMRMTADTDQPCSRSGGVPCAGERATCPLSEQLDLTEQQQKRLFGCCGGVCAKRRCELSGRTDELMAQLEQALNADPVDREQVIKLADEIAQLRAQEWKDRVRCVLEVRETLTPSQLERLAATVATP